MISGTFLKRIHETLWCSDPNMCAIREIVCQGKKRKFRNIIVEKDATQSVHMDESMKVHNCDIKFYLPFLNE